MNKSKKNNRLQIRNSTAEFLIFTKQAGGEVIEVRLQDGTVWLTQRLIAALFDTSSDNIGLHLKNIYAEGELNEISTDEDFSVVRQEGRSFLQKIRTKCTMQSINILLLKTDFLNRISTE